VINDTNPNYYPKPTLLDPPRLTESPYNVEANLDPRRYTDIAEYITQWLWCRGHNDRIRGLCDTDWDYAKHWWEEVERLRKSDEKRGKGPVTEYLDDGDRLERAAHIVVSVSDEEAKKLAWRCRKDMYDRLDQLSPNKTSEPPPVTWHLSATVKVTDIKDVGDCYLYELVLVDERRLKSPIPFEIEVPKDGEAQLREPEEDV